jgi:signal transduction histidine kinase
MRNSLTFPLQIDLIVPSAIEDNLLGFVILGEKLNHQPYSPDDLSVFTTLSHQAALAISYCLFLEEFKKAQERIFTAEKLASIGGMADGVAHQIRNRLNHFSMAAGEQEFEIKDFVREHPQLIEQNPDLKKSLDYIARTAVSIVDNVKRTASVIGGILNFAKVEEKDTFFSKFSLKEITDLSLNLLQTKHQITDFPLLVESPSSDTIYGVKAQLMECIFNIVDNGYEAIEEKRNYCLSEEEKKKFKSLIKVKLTHKENTYLLEISDNGIGVKEEDKQKIFAPFFTTKSSYTSGSGIGMYVVKRMVEENHKGKIWFESEYMKGTTFFIELPYKRGGLQ